MARYSGAVQGLCIHRTAALTGFCAKVDGGSLNIDEAAIENFGIGDKKIVRGGTLEAALQFQCVGVAAATAQLWFPTVAGVTVADFPYAEAASGFLVEADDGSAGQEFILGSCQPGAATVSISQARDAFLTYDFTVMSAAAALNAIGGHTPAYLSLIGHTINDCTVQIGGADMNALSFSLTNGMAISESNPMNTKASNKRRPSAYYRTAFAPSFSVDTEDEGAWLATGNTMLGDLLPAAADITIVLDNGTDAAQTITLHDFVPTSWGMDLAPQGLAGFRHTFIPSTGARVGRVTFA